jgi:hypothetical protein
MRSGGCPAGSGRALRLDPFALPVRYAAGEAAADGGTREIELHRERVVVRRSLSGMRMALDIPIAAFAGVGLRLAADEATVVLMHKDPGLALPLFQSDEPDDVTAVWRSWGAVLGLPLLVDGWDDPLERPVAVKIARPRPRRRRRSVLRRRRPSILMRRASGRLTVETPVHRGEREIIARN